MAAFGPMDKQKIGLEKGYRVPERAKKPDLEKTGEKFSEGKKNIGSYRRIRVVQTLPYKAVYTTPTPARTVMQYPSCFMWVRATRSSLPHLAPGL